MLSTVAGVDDVLLLGGGDRAAAQAVAERRARGHALDELPWLHIGRAVGLGDEQGSGDAGVEKLLLIKGSELREIAKNLYWYDYLDAKEMDKIYKGETIDKEKVREWESEK